MRLFRGGFFGLYSAGEGDDITFSLSLIACRLYVNKHYNNPAQVGNMGKLWLLFPSFGRVDFLPGIMNVLRPAPEVIN